MSKKSKRKLKLISSTAAISLISTVVVGTNKTGVFANPLSRLWTRIMNTANSLTLSNPFRTNKSVSLNKPSSSGKISSPTTPQTTTWQDFKTKFGDGSDIMVTSNESTTSSNKTTKSSLWSRFKSFFNSSSSKSYKIKTSGNTNPTFELEDIQSTANKEERKQRMLKSLYGDDAGIFTSKYDNETKTSVLEDERKQKLLSSLYGDEAKIFTLKTNDENNKANQRKKLLENLYIENSKIFVTGNKEDVGNNQAHFARLNDTNGKTPPPIPPKPSQLTVKALIHSDGSSSSGSNNQTSISLSSKSTK